MLPAEADTNGVRVLLGPPSVIIIMPPLPPNSEGQCFAANVSMPPRRENATTLSLHVFPASLDDRWRMQVTPPPPVTPQPASMLLPFTE